MSLKLFVEPYEHNSLAKEIIRYIPHIEVSIDECDYIVSGKIPFSCTDATVLQEVLSSYKDSSKKVIAFLLSDFNEPLDVPSNVLFFRAGMYKSQKKHNEYLIPYVWTKSELKNELPLAPLPKRTSHPIVGFCGYIASHPSRIQFINKLKQLVNIKKNFILKTEYWGGSPNNPTVVDEFINNIQNSHFTLSTRGTGNWSARFYQVLYLGRIPLFVNTDMVLPLEDKINWRDLIVYCDSENDIPNNLRNFWITKDVVEAQNRCREVYENYLAPEKWCKIITEEILIPNK